MARIRKFIAALAGVAAMVVSTGVLEETEEIWVNAGLALLTALGVYAVPNDRTSRGAHDPVTRT